MKRVILSWSSGKDSTWALGVLQNDPEIELLGLLTTVNRTHERVAMHAVREQLLREQAASIGLPLDVIVLCPANIGTASGCDILPASGDSDQRVTCQRLQDRLAFGEPHSTGTFRRN